MRNWTLFIACILSISSFAQEETKSEKIVPDYVANSLIFNETEYILELSGDVSFKTKYIEMEHVDRIIWNKQTNQIVVTGIKEFTIDGSIILGENEDKKVLRYQLGDRVAYLE